MKKQYYYSKVSSFISDNKIELALLFLLSVFVMITYTLNELYVHFRATRTFTITGYELLKMSVLGTLTLLTSTWYLINNKKPTVATIGYQAPKLPHRILIIQALCLVGIAGASFGVYIINRPTAFNSPPIDMGPFFERMADPNFSPNDFLTNASMQPSPRHVFGYFVVIIVKIFHTDWYSVFYNLFIFFIITEPLLLFLVIITALRRRIIDDRRYLFSLLLTCVLTLAALSPKVVALLSIGWWGPLFFGPAPQTLSLIFGLLFSLAALIIRSSQAYVFIPLLFIAAFVHPAVGLFALLFFLLLDFDKKRLRFYLVSLLFGIGGAYLLIIKLFSAQHPLSAVGFIYYYIREQHWHHYLVSSLSTFTNIHWYIIFCLVLSIFGAAALLGTLLKNSYLRAIGIATFLMYGGVVLAQYIFIEVIPLKAAAEIGPIRFTIFAYWLLVLIISYVIGQHLPQKLVPQINESKLTKKSIKKIYLSLIIILIGLFLVGVSNKDNPKQAFDTQYPGLLAWVQAKTTPQDVFVAPPDLPPTHIPLLLKRGVFIGNGFPFTEDSFVEYYKRKVLIYGSYEQLKSYHSDYSVFYRSLLPRDFLKAAKQFRLDYVIIEAKHSDAFSSCTPVFANESIKVYSIDDLKKVYG